MSDNEKIFNPFPHAIEDLGLSARSRNSLLAHDILTVEQLCCTSSVHLSTFRNFGRMSLREVERALDRVGLAVGCGRPMWARWSKGETSDGSQSIETFVQTVTMRDYFAAKAMAAVQISEVIDAFRRNDYCGKQYHNAYLPIANAKELAEYAYTIADAMLAAREAT